MFIYKYFYSYQKYGLTIENVLDNTIIKFNYLNLIFSLFCNI